MSFVRDDGFHVILGDARAGRGYEGRDVFAKSHRAQKSPKSPPILILRGCAHGRAAQAEARGEQFLSILRPLNSLKISKR